QPRLRPRLRRDRRQHRHRDYTGFNGNVDVNEGTVYFQGGADQTFTGDLTIAADGTASLERSSQTAGTSQNVSFADINNSGTMIATILDSGDGLGNNETLGFTYTGTFTNTNGDYKVAGEMIEGEKYKIVTSSGGSNTPGATSLLDEFEGLLADYGVYTDNAEVWAEMVDGSTRTLEFYALTRNARSVAGNLTRNPKSDLYQYIVYDSGWEKADAALVNRAFDLASGEIGASTATALLGHAQHNADMILAQSRDAWAMQELDFAGVGSDQGYAAASYCPPGARIWAEFDGYYNKGRDYADTYRGKTKSWGFAVGADAVVGDWLIGGGFRYGDGRLKVDHLMSRSDFDSYSFSLYGGRRFVMGPGALYLTGGYSFGYHDIDYRRRDIGNGTYKADYDGYSHTAYLDAAFGIRPSANLEFKPFANVMYNAFRNDAYTEKRHGGVSNALRVDSRTHDNLSTSLGLRLKATSNQLFVDASVAWRHTYGNLETRNDTRFVGTGSTFSILGNALARDEAVYAVGVGVTLGPKASLRAGYDGSVGKKTYTHRGSVAFDLKF
ncbi:MAG: autotransporter domain-containing protein, partial [Planctomycetes bacterium]|nr:autotransporter domain-containing protein [Planctomycetota bacterium]